MTVKELIQALKLEKEDALVCISRDSEGNGYSRLADGFAHGDFKSEPEWMKESFYGMKDGDFEKEYVILYPRD